MSLPKPSAEVSPIRFYALPFSALTATLRQILHPQSTSAIAILGIANGAILGEQSL